MNFLLCYLIAGVLTCVFQKTIGRLLSNQFDMASEFIVNSISPGLGTLKRSDPKKDKKNIGFYALVRFHFIYIILWPIMFSFFIFAICVYYGKNLGNQNKND